MGAGNVTPPPPENAFAFPCLRVASSAASRSPLQLPLQPHLFCVVAGFSLRGWWGLQLFSPACASSAPRQVVWPVACPPAAQYWGQGPSAPAGCGAEPHGVCSLVVRGFLLAVRSSGSGAEPQGVPGCSGVLTGFQGCSLEERRDFLGFRGFQGVPSPSPLASRASTSSSVGRPARPPRARQLRAAAADAKRMASCKPCPRAMA